MTYIRAVKEFKETHKSLWEEHADYWKAQEMWSAYTDNLCKSGQITQKQYDTWETPFPYGVRLGVMHNYT